MKNFLTKTSLIISPIILFGLCLILYTFDLPSTYDAKLSRLLLNSEESEGLILGNSHAAYSINPEEIKSLNIHNLANPGQLLYQDSIILNYVLNNCPSIKTVLISFDYHSLYSLEMNRFRKQNFESVFLRNNNIFSKIRHPLELLSLTKRKANGTLYSDSEYSTLNETINSKGFVGLKSSEKNWNDSKRFIKRISGFQNAYNSKNFQKGTRVLENMIITCKKNNLEPILVSSPTYFEYNGFLNPRINQAMDSVSSYLQVRHNIQYFNFMNSTNFDKTDFYNGDHLNITGSEKFSRIIDSCLEAKDS